MIKIILLVFLYLVIGGIHYLLISLTMCGRDVKIHERLIAIIGSCLWPISLFVILIRKWIS